MNPQVPEAQLQQLPTKDQSSPRVAVLKELPNSINLSLSVCTSLHIGYLTTHNTSITCKS